MRNKQQMSNFFFRLSQSLDTGPCNITKSVFIYTMFACVLKDETFLFVTLFSTKIKQKRKSPKKEREKKIKAFRIFRTKWKKKIVGIKAMPVHSVLCTSCVSCRVFLPFRIRQQQKQRKKKTNVKICAEFKFSSHNSINISEFRWNIRVRREKKGTRSRHCECDCVCMAKTWKVKRK